MTQRAATYAHIRKFFTERGVTEVQTPTLDRFSVTDPNLHSIEVPDEGWLQTSPEYAMKRLLAAGSGDIYQIARAFRAEESGAHHLIEFTLLEWYRLGYDHLELMRETAELLAELLLQAQVQAQGGFVAHSYRECFEQALGLNPHSVATSELQQLVAEKLKWQGPVPSDDLCLDLLFTHSVAPNFTPGAIIGVYDYPASQAALSRIRQPENLASRFELFYKGVEMANGFHELADASEQRARFEADNSRRLAQGLSVMQLDERLLQALQSGLPDCSGVAVGLDRVLMLQLGVDSVNQVSLTRDSS